MREMKNKEFKDTIKHTMAALTKPLNSIFKE